MAVTLYRQVGKGKARATRRSILGAGADRPIFPVPISCGTRSLTAPVHGKRSATISMRRSSPVKASRHTSMLSTQTCPSFTNRTMLVAQKSPTPFISGSLSFSCFRAKTSRARARRRCGRTTTASASFPTSLQNNLRYLDQIDRKQLLRYVKFLRKHDSDLDDRTVHNVFETLNTFLQTRDIFTAGKSLPNWTTPRSRRSPTRSTNSRRCLQ
jgi:hypothetical protein